MLDRAYLVRQIRTLLKFAKSTSDPRMAAFLMDKAIHLKSQVEEVPPATDRSPLAPDVDPEKPEPKVPPGL
ncbi:hypothetical protein [Bradyrhizobium sp.]|uniref:hypothetical protein n=1 Tax=Bradyrhizobium sp. TaxID=376 RepID=UPI002392C90C|nr:hypothetical protein [Bradyrhizobium sp.]MDE2378382.1 hypothetical protein [Bradyrhizobium sp.]